MMDRFSEMSTFSPREVADTLKALAYGYAGKTVSPEQMEGAYMFASELLGVSVDALGEYVNESVEPKDEKSVRRFATEICWVDSEGGRSTDEELPAGMEGLPERVELPSYLDEDAIADWLSDNYEFLVEEFTIETEETPWRLCGDINTAEYGGTLVRVDERGDLEYIHIAVSSDSDDKFLLHGTIVDPKDYLDEDSIGSDAMDSDCSPEEYLSKYPAAFADTLFSGYGCGIFEFSPSNINGQGCYSMRYEDFTATDKDIVKFLKEMEVPCDTYLSVM